MGKKDKKADENKEPKEPFKVRFGKWLHHESTGPDDEETYCGTRTGDRWRQLLLFYFLFYGMLVCFWAICFQAMFANIPARIGGSGPSVNTIKGFGFTQVFGATPDYSTIASDDGTFVTAVNPQAFGTFRSRLGATDYGTLQTAITAVTGGQSGNQFLWENCTVGVNGCTAASNYGTFGPVYLVTYRNRKWNRPQEGSGCNITCTYTANFDDGTTGTGTIQSNHFWQLDFATGVWINGRANLDCSPFQNQPTYRAYTAVSTEGYTRPVTTYTLTCNIRDLSDDPTGSAVSTYVA